MSKENLNSLVARLIAVLLMTAFFLSLLYPQKSQAAFRNSSSLSSQTITPVFSLPEPFQVSSSTSRNSSFNFTVLDLTSSILNLFSTSCLPEDFEMAKTPTLTDKISSFFAPLFFAPNSSATAAALLLPSGTTSFDFDGDGRADVARWQSATGEWKIKNSSNGQTSTYLLGLTGNTIAPADYDGDGKTDSAVFNASAGVWTIKKSSDGTTQTITGFGQSGDKAVAGDYDGDGLADAAVWRSSNGTWYIRKSSDTSVIATSFGASSDIPVAGNYDGDSRMDYAVFRPSEGNWYILGSSAGFIAFQWGLSSDIPVPADYDGDNKTDFAVYRPTSGTWYAYKSSTNDGSYIAQNWGNYGDQPVPADYDGDNKADFTVWRPTTGVWFSIKSSDNNYDYKTLGIIGDTPVPSAYLKQTGAQVSAYDLAKARLSPKNATGGTDFYSRNFGWSSGLVGLSGRAGLNAGFGVSYNSLVWTKQGNTIVFDAVNSNVSPGFRFGFPTIEPAYYDSQTGRFAYLMVSPSGARTEFRQTGASSYYETADLSYVQLYVKGAESPNTPVENLSLTVTGTDGTKMRYGWIAGAFRLSQIKDSNGNFIAVSHDEQGLLRTVTDTLGRVITVNYDSQLYPTTITQTWQNGTHAYATFDYTTIAINTNFDSSLTVFGPANGTTLKVLNKITFANGGSTRFDYNSYGQVWRVNNHAADNHKLNHLAINLDSIAQIQTDCPRFSETKSYVENFNNGNEIVIPNSIQENQTYNVPGASGAATLIQVTAPNGVVSKTYVGSSGWREGLPIVMEDWANEGQGLTRKRWSWTNYTQDNPNLSYIDNPRVIETKVGDETNVKRTTIDYYVQSGNPSAALYGLTSEVKIYDANQTSILKRSVTEYNLDNVYVSRRIIGLPSKSELYDGQGAVQSKTTYNYDEGDFSDASLEQNISPIQHDGIGYGANFITGRGNLTSTTRWDVSGQSLNITSSVKYNTSGASVAQIDPLNRTVKIAYADVFNDAPTNRNTFAYPTRLTDAAGNYSEVKYRFDIGANVWAKSPAPQNQTNGKTTERLFDSIGRISKETITNTGAYSRYEYPANGIQNKVYSTIIDTNNNGADTADEVLAESWTDGAGRVRQSRTEHPGSLGGFSGQLTEYDILGRVTRLTIPTEIDTNWNPAGDDLTRGWLWTQTEYDWKSRVTRTVNTDGTDTLTSYEGCGCAGGQITTINSEIVLTPELNYNARRTQKIYSDILGRTFKTVVMNWDGTTPYTTTVQTFNGRDQATEIKQFQGTETSNNFQTTTIAYDGHGRIKIRHNPIENVGTNTTWIYNQDDSIGQVIDPRGAMTTFSYNDARGLLTNISYGVPAGSSIPAASSVSFGYDAVGNRTQMSDGTGTTTYAYDQLSRITSETRQFNGLSNNFNIEYEYTLAGGLKQIKDPSDISRSVGYTYNKAGVLTAITGGGFGGVTQYLQNRSVRAFGAVKREDYGNGFRLEQQYDTRQRISLYNIINPNQTQNQGNVTKIEYEYTASSQLKRANNVLAGNFSRNFVYDHIGRLKDSATDAVAEIGAASFQSMEYDVWDNMTSRTSAIWGTSYVANVGSIYSNNRNTRSSGWNSQTGATADEIWQYDAGGMPTVTGEQTHKYDAAGQKIESVDRPIVPPGYINSRNELLIQQTYDGNSQTAKRFERETFTNAPVRTETVYYLRSTVLGGKLLAEIIPNGANGAKRKEYVYNDTGEAIAFKNDTNQVKWIYVAPSIGSKFEADVVGTTSEGKEYDPLGGEVSFQPPPPQGSPDWLYTGKYDQNGNWLDLNGGCMRGGFPIDCSEAARVAGFGDPRTLNDTCPSCGGGGGMWLSPEQVQLLEKEGIEFGWDWIGGGRIQPIGEGGRIKGGYTFNSFLQTRQTGDPYGKIPLVKKLRSKERLSQEDCDTYLAKIFGDGSSIVTTKNEPLGVGQSRKYPLRPGMDRESHLGNNGVFHMYANPDGSAANISAGQGGMYIPDGGRLLNPTAGEYAEQKDENGKVMAGSTYSNEFIFNYKGGLAIKVFHVGGTIGNGKDHNGNILQPDKNDRNGFGHRIGYVGGLGGESSDDYVHSHWEFNVNGKRVDPRKLFCNW